MRSEAASLAASSALLPPLLLLLLLLPPLLSHSVDAAGISPLRNSPRSQDGEPSTGLPPFLRNIRDYATELFFGRHPNKVAGRPAVPKSLRAEYSNELVLRFSVTTTDEETALSEAAARLFLDVWAFTDDFVDIRLHAHDVDPLLSLLPPSLHLSHSVLISDLASAVHRSLPSSAGRTMTDADDGAVGALTSPLRASDNLFFQDYQPLSVIVRWMRLLEAMFPSHAKYITVGTSFEGREIPALRVGVSAPSSPEAPRQTLVVTGGLHAREWISTSTVNYLAWSFITSFGKERFITKLLNKFDIVFIPAVNPDGVEYTWQVDRLWRKTRQQTNTRFCHGVDLDRAFGYEWDGSRFGGDPCSESYGGEQPFEAVEARELATWARNETVNHVKFVGLVDLHSYSQQILFPFSFSCAVEPPNLENLEEVATGIAKAIRISNGESYSVTSACEGAVVPDGSRRDDSQLRIESGGGSAMDWFYHEMHAHFSYQIKLRDTGAYGFLVPKDQIIPTGEEMFNAMKYFGDYLLGNNGIERSRESSAGAGKVSSQDDKGDDGNMPQSQELRRRRVRE